MSSTRLVAQPELAFASLTGILSQGGWRLDSQSQQPIVPGEPEWAVYMHSASAGRIHYTFNPVVSLRALDFRGEGDALTAWQEASFRIPAMDGPRLRSLLESGDKRSVLLALFAAAEMEEIGVMDLVLPLCEDSDARISAAATRTRDALMAEGIAQARRILTGERAIAEAFSRLPVLEWRRQTLRWLAHDNRESNSAIGQVLCAALTDPDAEVRMTAVLAAAKLNARDVLDHLRRTRVPESTSEGAPEHHRLFYREIHRAALRYLTTGASTEAFQNLLNGSLDVTDDPTLLLHALLTPVELGPEPASLPQAIEPFEKGYRLRKSGVLLRWIAPIEHWLGADGALDNPVRRVKPQSGFFIAAAPLQEPCDYQEALRRCQQIADRESAEIVLPTADQWEMAARGPDGRYYPWGNSALHEGDHSSPWGVRDLIGRGPEWTRPLDGKLTLCGSIKLSPCSHRTRAVGSELSAMRLLVEN